MKDNKVQDSEHVDYFSYSPEQLSDLVEAASVDLLNSEYGGVNKMMESLKTNPKIGLCDTELCPFEHRRKTFGTNTYPVPPAQNIIVMFINNLKDTTLLILMFVSIVSIGLGLGFPDTPHDRQYGWIEGFTILVAVIIVSSVTAVNDWMKERKFRALNKESKKIMVSCLREGRNTEILIDDLLVGDIVCLRTGDQVPADGLYIAGYDLKIDESAVTGETDLLKKSKDSPFLKSGTQVAEGNGDMIVIAVGPYSQWGKTLGLIASGKLKDEETDDEEKGKELTNEEKARKAEAESDQTPLEIKLDGLAANIGKLGLSAGVITVVVLFVGWIIRKVIDVNNDETEWALGDLRQIVNFVLIGITIVVVAVPEGLPLAVTISLAYSVREMLQDNNLVRHLAACETMGGASNICSDKTGTLTLNQMNVVQGFFGGRDYGDRLSQLLTNLPSSALQLLIDGIVVNCKASLLEADKVKEEDTSSFKAKLKKIGIKLGFVKVPKVRKANAEDRWKVVGSKTEGALLLMLVKHFNKTIEWPEQQLKEYQESHAIAMQYTFSSKRKRMSTVMRLNHHPHSYLKPDLSQPVEYSYRLYTKGASEIILADCATFLNQRGEIETIDERKRAELMSCIENMANQGLRTLCLAYRDFSQHYPEYKKDDVASSNTEGSGSLLMEEHDGYTPDKRELEFFDKVEQSDLEKELTVIAIVGIKDPVRDEVPEAIRTCKRAGITVRMVTGDNILTAKHIARECGILYDDGIAIEGPDFRKMTDEELQLILPKLQVMARSSPADKFKLVTKLRELGEVVAVTGDGTNDGPALKAADVGLAMGISGTQVAKEASDIIIMDDNFESIVQSVKWGRCVFENIRRFLVFQISVNIVALVLTIITALTTFIIGKREEGSHVIAYKPPLTTVQLLWVNLIMDTFAALALATEKPTDDLLLRKPYKKKESLISGRMWIFILVQSSYQLTVLFVEYYAAEAIGVFKWEKNKHRIEGLNRTLVFNTFVLCQWFNQFNARKINFELNIFQNLWRSPMFILISLITLGMQAAFVNIESRFTQTTRLDWRHWLISTGLGFMSIPVGYVVRIIARLVLAVVVRSDNMNQVELTSNTRSPEYRKVSDAQFGESAGIGQSNHSSSNNDLVPRSSSWMMGNDHLIMMNNSTPQETIEPSMRD